MQELEIMTLGRPAYSPWGERLSTQLLPLLSSYGFICVFWDQNHVLKSYDFTVILSYRKDIQQKWSGNLHMVGKRRQLK